VRRAGTRDLESAFLALAGATEGAALKASDGGQA
jgi:hypothetical protein